MRFARIVFLVAGIYGLIVIAPQFFLENVIVRATGPITHPEYFYGFLCVTLPWQVLFLVISRDPERMRPAMPVAVLEKIGFPIASAILYGQGRVEAAVLGFASIDVLLAVLFTTAFLRTSPGTAAAARDR